MSHSHRPDQWLVDEALETMGKDGHFYTEHACRLLGITSRKPKDDLCGKSYIINDKEANDEASTSTTAPHTPSANISSKNSGWDLSPSDLALEQRQFLVTEELTELLQSRQSSHQFHISEALLTFEWNENTSCAKFDSEATCKRDLAADSKSPTLHVNGLSASSCNNTKIEGGLNTGNETRFPTVQRGESEESNELFNERSKTDAERSALPSYSETTSLQQLLQRYRYRRAAFENNSFQRYKGTGQAAKNRVADSGGWSLMATEHRSRWTPAQAKQRKAHELDGAEQPSTSSEEGSAFQTKRDPKRVLNTCAEAEVYVSERGTARRAKGTGHRCGPYRPSRLHYLLPEPENKMGLLTHPTPAQFNKYPKARGVWFDPHRNLVRTCWKENGRARTMGFPVNKFGLEEARTLAVEYHYYKCPTDPLPDDLSSLIPRKPPHAYGWC